jgi:hypothetical protein
MRYTLSYMLDMAVGATCLVMALMAVRALVDSDRPRLSWAKTCLWILAVAAALAGITTGLDASGRTGLLVRPAVVRHVAACLRWFTIGLFLPLAFSGQWSAKKPPQ